MIAFRDDGTNQKEFVEDTAFTVIACFSPGPSSPTERLQLQPDTENTNVHRPGQEPTKCQRKPVERDSAEDSTKITPSSIIALIN